jgi:ankyrin repeat protein
MTSDPKYSADRQPHAERPPVPEHSHFLEALSFVDSGDIERLGDILAAHPDLVYARSTSVEPPYDGYFHGATLLHHVAGNPQRADLPANVVRVAEVLIEHGADVEAGCGGGPSQPGSANGTVLGLVTSGAHAHVQGHTESLIDILLDHGAHLDPEGGMFGTLYHTVEHRGQREVARMLHARGVRADLPIAAGLGDVDLMASFIGRDGELVAGADQIWSRTARDGSRASDTEILNDALLAASANGWPEAVTWLLDSGAPIDGFRSWGPFPVTALHCAAWAGWPDVVGLLLERGADATIREPTHDGTPLVWAAHTERTDVVKALREAGIRE